jgi:lysophospholipase L1-like esterase
MMAMRNRRGLASFLFGSLLLLVSLAQSPAMLSTRDQFSLANVGDSRSVETFDFATTDIQRSAAIHLNWMNAFSSQAFRYTGDFSLSGISTQTMRNTYLPLAIASKPTFITIYGGVNNPNAGISYDQTYADLVYMTDQVLQAGIRPILFTDPGAENFNTSQATAWHGAGGLNDKLRAYAASNSRIILFDTVPVVIQQQTPLVIFKTGYANDGVHLSVPGAQAMGAALATTMQAVIGTPPTITVSDNRLVNAGFNGTNGTLGTSNTGTVPTRWTGAAAAALSTSAFAINTLSSGTNEIAQTVTSTSGSAISPSLTGSVMLPTSLPVGTKLVAGATAIIDAGGTHFAYPRVAIAITYSDATFDTALDIANSASNKADIDLTSQLNLTLRTNPIVVSNAGGKTITGFTFTLRAAGNPGDVTPAVYTVRWRNPWLRISLN